MNYGITGKVLGTILIIEAMFMLPSLGISFFEGEQVFYSFLFTICFALVLGFILRRIKENSRPVSSRDGLVIVSLSWIIVSIVGALPLFISGEVPNFVDSLFEIVSGFTTTGATVISNVEGLSNSIIFWRSFTHWIGGMGILVFTIALLPMLGIGGFQIFKAESPGPTADKIAPRMKDTAKILYKTYFAMTILEVLLLLFGGMSLFESLINTFGTVGTGGFSNKNNSIGFYDSTYIQLVIGTFMILSGINFSLYYSAFKGKFGETRKNDELKWYLIIVFSSVLLISINLFFNGYGKFSILLKDAYFQVGSIITTTGYSTTDFNLWPSFSKLILFLLMFIGGCAGSTAGGMKVIRIVVLFKLIKKEFIKIFHPRAVVPVKVNDEVVSQELGSSIMGFLGLYIIIFISATLLISLEGVDIVTASSSVVATLSNIGPGLELVGPASNFGFYSNISKLLFSFLMLLGRLELFTLLALILPRRYGKH